MCACVCACTQIVSCENLCVHSTMWVRICIGMCAHMGVFVHVTHSCVNLCAHSYMEFMHKQCNQSKSLLPPLPLLHPAAIHVMPY